MWSRVGIILVIFAFYVALVASATDELTPRQLFRQRNTQKQLVSVFSDPIDGKNYRLPNTTTPLLYEVFIHTDIHRGNFEFTGAVKIFIEALQDTPTITLHYRQLTIIKIDLLNAANTLRQANVPYNLIEDLEFIVITPTVPLTSGEMLYVNIEYTGTLRDDDLGFYRSSYINNDGDQVWLATTQFESTEARHAFPCYDEPGIRSRFQITIEHDKSYTAISNEEVESGYPVPVTGTDYLITKFFETPEVQSYLIAFIVSDFKFVEDVTGVTKQRVYAKEQSIDKGHASYAIEVSRPILEKFEEYLGLNYQLRKMDQAAMPDFDAGAMENWGLVTYREQYLLLDEHGTTRDRENIIATIVHEFAHQWFGNLVSPTWWSYLWLNEGFATLFEYHMLHVLYPDERWIDTYVVDIFQYVLESDADPNIRPMNHYVESPEGIDNLFDDIAYYKASAVLRMFLHAIGESTFKRGLTNYLNARGYKSGTPHDLHYGLQAAIDVDGVIIPMPITNAMSSWENEGGFPYITVARNGNQLELEQHRFMYSNRNSTYLWTIPITFYTKSSPDHTRTTPDFWFSTRDGNLSPTAGKLFAANDWIIFNTQQTGYYRVNYDTELWNFNIAQLNNASGFSDIHVLNRAQLIDDSFHLARGGVLQDFTVTLRLMDYLEHETDYIPWASANRINTLLYRWLASTAIQADYEAFIAKNVRALFNRLTTSTVPNEPRVDRYARNVAINLACLAQYAACLTQTRLRVERVVYEGASVEPDLISSVYCNGLRTANATVFTSMQDKILTTDIPSERIALQNALGCTQNSELLIQFLNMALVPEIALSNEEKRRILLSPLNHGGNSVRVLINFVKENSQAINALGLLTTLVENLSNRIHSQALYVEFVDQLLQSLRTSSLLTESETSVYASNANSLLAWQQANLAPIATWFGRDLTTTTTESTPEVTTQSTTSTTGGAGIINISLSVASLVALIFVKIVI